MAEILKQMKKYSFIAILFLAQISLFGQTPNAPNGLTASSTTSSTIKLTWTDNSSNETGFVIERSQTSGSSYTVINTTAANATSYTDTGLESDTTYYYRIKAINTQGSSAYTAEATATTLSQFTDMTSIYLTVVDNSSVAWGDYDNDGYLDILLTGYHGYNRVSKIYKNTETGFKEQASISLTGVLGSSVAWGDYDNDGDLDILLTGSYATSHRISKIYKNTGIGFEEQTSISLTGVEDGSVAWGDYDNDGDLDILLTGHDDSNRISKIYKNTGSGFEEQTSISLTGVDYSSVAWGDYDNDGDLDILLNGGGSSRISKIYKNNGNNTFTEQTSVSLIGVYHSSVAWGDYDNDGDLDILLTGDDGSNSISKIYKYTGTGYKEQTSISIAGVYDSSVAWGDYDNDGDLDILLTGDDGSNSISKIYKNTGTGFEEQTSISLTGVGNSSVAWGDYDNDGDLDILLTGDDGSTRYSKIYRNNIATPNTAPQAPTKLTSNITNYEALLSWTAATDAETPSLGLTYNVFVRTATDTIVMPHSDPVTGFVKQPSMGNAQHGTEFLLKEHDAGTYYWKVQAVDNCFAGGAFSAEGSFVIDEIPQLKLLTHELVFNNPPIEVSTTSNADIIIESKGNTVLNINDVSGLEAPFTYTGGTIFSVLVDSSKSFNIEFSPTKVGIFYDTLEINSNDYDNPVIKIPIVGYAATFPCNTSTVITTDTTWTKAESPYYIECANISVTSGVRLTIEAGVEVLLNDSSSLIIDGTLDVQGTEADTVRFTNSGGANFSQLYFRSGSTGNFNYFKIENADKGIYAESSTLALTNGVVQNCGNGVEVSSTTVNMDYCDISNNSTDGFYYSSADDSSMVTVSNSSFNLNNNGADLYGSQFHFIDCIFNGNVSNGINLDRNAGGTIESSLCRNNNWGIYSSNDYGWNSITITGCIIENNNTDGIYVNRFCTITDNTITGNTQNGINSIGTNTIENNTISGNLTGIYEQSNSIIRYNEIFSNTEDGIETNSTPTVNYNNIYGNTVYNFHATQQDAVTIDASNNYWGTAIESEIQTSIYDYFDDGTTATVNYSPYLNATAIMPPTNLSAVELGMTKIQLTWTDNTADETGFVIERSQTSGSGFTVIDTTAANATSYTDTGLESDTTYYYRIKATNAQISSAYTDEATATTLGQFTEMTAISLTGVSYSSVDWGDYDNDGDLDILLTGDSSANGISKIYQNTGTGFEEKTSISLARVLNSSVAWGDYDNDGDLDILLTGYDGASGISKIYKNTETGFKEQKSISLAGVSSSSAAWGDYDNDGNLDILLTGYTGSNKISKIYKNTGSGFEEQTSISLAGVWSSSVAWGDYDNDGDLDILLTGDDGSNSISKIYKNTGSGFEEQTSISLPGVYISSVEWGDYDNDGDLDILLTGFGVSNRISKIYKNTGSGFEEQTSISLTGVEFSSVAWGDYDNDGDLDILLSGNDGSNFVSKIYKNTGTGFEEQTSISLTGVHGSSVVWSDYDSDGDLDILLTGSDISKIYRNNTATPNTAPQAPTSLAANITNDQALLSWAAATDAETPSLGLTYNVFVRTASDTIVMPHSDLVTGFVKQPSMGNAQLGTEFLLKELKAGTYYWKVQAVDNAFAGGKWSAEDTFVIEGCGTPPPATSNVEVCSDAVPTVLTVEGTSINWYANGNATGLLTTANNYTHGKTIAGTYNYFVSQTINGCESELLPITLTIKETPSLNNISLIEPSSCTTEDGEIHISASSSLALSYSINAGTDYSSQSDYIGLKAGFHVVKVVSENGCKVSKFVNLSTGDSITPPTGENAEICFGENNKALTASGTNLKWYSENGTELATGNTYTPDVSQDSTYTYMVTNVSGYCQSEPLQIIYTIHPLPDIIITGNQMICQGSTTTLSASGAQHYDWQPNTNISNDTISNPVFSPVETTEYSLSATSEYNCITEQNITITVNPTPDVSVISGETELCRNQLDVVYNATDVANSVPNWTIEGGEIISGENTRNIVVNWDSSYSASLGITNTFAETACRSEISELSIYKSGNKAPTKAKIFLKGTSILVLDDNSVDNYQWYHNNVAVDSAINRFCDFGSINLSDDYYCVSSYANGCSTESYHYPNSTTSLIAIEQNEILIYPNPNNGTFILEFKKPLSKPLKIEIIGLTGKRIFSKDIQSGVHKFSVNPSNKLSSGIYFINLQKDGIIMYNGKIIVE